MSEEMVSVRVTVAGHGESFWVRRVPDEPSRGVVANALLNGACSYGDVVEWNEEGDVTAVVSRSDRATVACWVDIDPDDVATQAKWAQRTADVHRQWSDRGVVVEGGFGSMLVAAFLVHDGLSLNLQCLQLLANLAYEDWQLEWTLCTHPATPTDPAALGLTVPPPYDYENDELNASGLPDISGQLLDDNERRALIRRLKELGHIHAAIDDEELLAVAVDLVRNDLNFYRCCQAGRNDRVLVGAACVASWHNGLLAPTFERDVLEMDFLAG